MSTPRIQILPPHIVNRIAAGEVVERPASVVKELVENALDAGATRIDVSASAGGRMIRVADDGCGMSPEDARLAFFNHATSKITPESDLSRIETLGFRGEALASITSIARVTCLTRTHDAARGTKVTFDAEGNPFLSEAGCAPGTILEIEDLFYNTPARLKFLKRPHTELGHIEEMLQNLALANPHVQFSLTLNDKPALKTSGSGDVRLAMEEVLKSARDGLELLPFEREDEDTGYKAYGYLSSPGVTKNTKRWLLTFVNGRTVRCPVLGKAMESAYESLIEHGRYPVAVVFFSLPADEVDVNVHPTKREVRYASNNGVFSFVRSSMRDALMRHGFSAYQPQAFAPISTESAPVQLNTFRSGGLFAPSGGGGGGFLHHSDAIHPRHTQPTSQRETKAALGFYQPLPEGGTSELSEAQAPQEKFKVIGQLFNTYILLETVQGLMVVDQHIASERTFFEALSRSLLAGMPDVQQLLTAVPLSVTPSQFELLNARQEDFGKLGFFYSLEMESHTVQLTGVPIIYQGREPKHLFESLLAHLEETGEMKLDLDHLLATLSCHSAVRAGDTLLHHEMQEVIARWLACTLPWTCPHGRPIAHTISAEQLNTFFHRPSLPVNAF